MSPSVGKGVGGENKSLQRVVFKRTCVYTPPGNQTGGTEVRKTQRKMFRGSTITRRRRKGRVPERGDQYIKQRATRVGAERLDSILLESKRN